MVKLKRFITLFISIIIILVIILNYNTLKERLSDFFNITPEIVIKPSNEYTKDNNYILISQVEEYIPYNYNDLLNIFYSILNQGWTEFTFYCPSTYTSCIDDISKISYDEVLLSDINNYVHPYNSYSTIKTLYDDTGEITIKVTHLYSDSEIKQIDSDINKIISENINENMSDKEKVKVLHDYIINNTKYDSVRANNETSDYDSTRILGLLYEHYAICSAYSDTMAVMLSKLGIDNFKVSSETHVWNAVYIDGTWLNLDLTWDDPITSTGKDILDDTYFLITTQELLDIETSGDHNFDQTVYQELAI